MVTIEQIEEVFGENQKAFTTKDIDYEFTAISLLRSRIPYEACKSIVGSAEHDVIYLCGIDDALAYLSEQDLCVLADCNVCIDREYDCFYMFV